MGGNGGGVSSTVIGGIGLFADGTAAAPSISFLSDPDTGLYLDAANTLGIATGGVGTVIFSSSAGIGKIKAHGSRVLALEAGTGNTNITLTPSGTGGVYLGTTVATGTATPLVLSSGGTYGTLFSNGLKLLSYDDGTSRCGVGNTATTMFLGANFATPICFVISSADVARFHANGRLGIGTGATDSGALLQIGTESTTTLAGGAIFGTAIGLYRASAGELALDHLGGTSAILSLYNSGTRRVIMQASGTTFNLFSTGGSVVLGSNNTTALTLDSSQNATFAAAIQTVSVVGFGATADSSTFVGIGAGTTGRSSLRIPHGVAPTAPVNGDMWTTTAGAFIRINGVTKTFTLI